MSVLDTLKSARAPERSVQVCMRGDLVSRYEDLERELREVSKRDVDSFSGTGEATAIVERMQEVQNEMHAAEVTFRFRAIGAMPSLELAAGHPPRADNARDKSLGYNPTSYYPAVIRAACYAIDQGDDSLDPADMSEEDWEALFAALSSQQFDQVFGAAWLCDHQDIEVPTSPLALLISQRGDESSTQHSAGARDSSGSKAGSRRGSPRTSTTKKAASPEA